MLLVQQVAAGQAAVVVTTQYKESYRELRPPSKGRVQPPGQSSWALPLKAKGYWRLYMISASIRIKAVVGHCVTPNILALGPPSGAG